MSSRLHVRCLEYKCHCVHHLPSVSCTVVTWALLPWTDRFTPLVKYQDKAWYYTWYYVVFVFSSMHPHLQHLFVLQRSCLSFSHFLQLWWWWPFWTTIFLYQITSIFTDGQNSNIILSSYFFISLLHVHWWPSTIGINCSPLDSYKAILYSVKIRFSLKLHSVGVSVPWQYINIY